jgi:hypothetical protein
MKFYSTPIKVLSTLFITSLILLSYSCEEVINVDLNSADPKIVIEGTITDQPGPYTVSITKTTDYYNPSSYPAVSGAQVRLVDDLGFSEQLMILVFLNNCMKRQMVFIKLSIYREHQAEPIL